MDNLKDLIGSAKQIYGHKSDEELAALGYKRVEVKEDENTVKYWASIRNIKPKKDTDEQRKRKIKTKLSALAKRVNKEFIPTEQQVALMRLLYGYFSGDDSVINPNKGLLIIGNTGVGKTSILTAFLSVPFDEYIGDEWYQKKPKITSCIDVVDWFDDCNSRKDWIDWKDKYKGDWYFSDLGTEPKHRYASSDSEPVIAKLLEYRDNRATGKTYFCTNLTEQEIADKYGQRVYSRILGSCNVINLNLLGVDKDFRR